MKRHIYEILCLCLYVTFVGSMYYIENVIYGGAIKTSWLSFALYGALFTLLQNLFSKNTEKKEQKHSKITTFLLFIAAFALSVYGVKTMPYILAPYRLFLCVIVCVSISFFKDFSKKIKDENNTSERFIFFALIWLALIVQPFIFCEVLGVYSVSDAEEMLTEEGYTDAEYRRLLYNVEGINLFFDDDIVLENENELELDAYIFTANKDGVEEVISVSVLSGRVLSTIVNDDSNAKLYALLG